MNNEWIVSKTAYYNTYTYYEGPTGHYTVEVSRFREDEDDEDEKVFKSRFVLLEDYECADACSGDAEYAYAAVNRSMFTRSQLLLPGSVEDRPMLILEDCEFTEEGKTMSTEEKGDCIMNALVHCLNELLYLSPEGLLFLYFREDEEETLAFDLAQMSDEYMNSEYYRMVITRNENVGSEKNGYYRCYAGVVRTALI